MFACLAKFLLVLLPLSQIPIASSLVINQVRERDSDLSNSTIAAACSAPQPTATPSAPAGDTCGDWYKFFFDHFEIHGKNFDPNKFGTDGSGLHDNIKGCGRLTRWHFTYLTNDPNGYQWFAKGNLPIGTKSCVGRAVISAGGSTADGCKGAG